MAGICFKLSIDWDIKDEEKWVNIVKYVNINIIRTTIVIDMILFLI